MSNNNENKEPLNKSFREPKLRFPEFKDEWNSIFLKDLVSIHARIGWQGLRQEEFLNEGDYYLITGTDFKNGRINLKEIKYISKFRYEQDKNIQVTNGDILITKDGSIGKVALVKDMNKSATLNAGVYRIRPLKNNVISAYLFQYLSAPFLLNFALKQSSGGTIKHLNQSQIIKFKIPLPSTNEQNKISRFLNLIDNKIETLEAKISTLKKYKEGLMHYITKNCKIYCKISDLVEICDKTHLQSSYGSNEGTYPFFVNSTDNIHKKTNDYIFNGEYLILNTGGSAYCNYYNGKFSAMSDCLVLKPKEKSMSIYFYLKTKEKKINFIGFQGTGLKHLDQDWLLRQKCPISIYENDYLRKINFKIDKMVRLYEQEYEWLLSAKRTLLMNIFI